MKKFCNFCKSLDNLKAIYDYDEPYDNIIMAGMVNLFQICYEQSWKAVKEILEQNGFTGFITGSPRQVIKTAYQAHIIKDENAWPLVSRNNAAYTHNEDITLEIIALTKEVYYNMFCSLREELAENWIAEL